MSNLPDPLFMQVMNALLWLLIIIVCALLVERKLPKPQLALLVIFGFIAGIFSEHFPLFF
jgi:hypothetical protein